MEVSVGVGDVGDIRSEAAAVADAQISLCLASFVVSAAAGLWIFLAFSYCNAPATDDRAEAKEPRAPAERKVTLIPRIDRNKRASAASDSRVSDIVLFVVHGKKRGLRSSELATEMRKHDDQRRKHFPL